MEAQFLIFTSPVNEKLVQTAPNELYDVLSQMFALPFSKQNTGFSYDARMSPDKMHVFDRTDYVGWIVVLQEGSDAHQAISTSH